MAASAVINVVVSRHLLRVGRETDSPALVADGHHLQTDVLTSLGVLAGLVLVRQTGQRWWDSLAALAVSAPDPAGRLWPGAGRGGDAVRHGPAARRGTGADAGAEGPPRSASFHKLRTRKSGSHRHVDVHVQIADTHTFVEAHRLTEDLEDELRAALPNLHPIIHIEPYEDEAQHQRERHGKDK